MAQWSQQAKYAYLGKYTGELLREDIERKIQNETIDDIDKPDKLFCYFAHDSTLASFYYAFDLDKKYSDKLVVAKFCSYFAIECTIS